MNDETFQSPQDDGQRAVIRRIDDENTTTSDPALPVLEHVVTPTFARTVDHRVVDEELNNLFSEDMSGNEPGNPVFRFICSEEFSLRLPVLLALSLLEQ